MKKNDFAKYLSDFLSKYLPGQRNASPHTIASYRDVFKLLLIFCDSVKSIKPEKIKASDLSKELVLDFLDWLETERKCSVSTRNQRLAVIHSFVHYVQKESPENLYELRKILSIPNKKYTRILVAYLTGEEMQILLSQPDMSTTVGFRSAVLLSVLYDTGSRVQELINIRVKDVRLSSPAVIRLHGKGDKVRQVPLMGKTSENLRLYLQMKKYHSGISRGDNFLFVNQKKNKLSRWGVSYILNKYVAKARNDVGFNIDFPVTPHVLRHSKAMHLLQSGVNLIYIRDFLGHVDCSTTEVYARTDSEMKRKAIEKAYVNLVPEAIPKWGEDGNLMKWLNSICH
jgi:site-specific recombinase XerD